MKSITIRLTDVELAMLVEVQKRNKEYKNLQGILGSRIRSEYQKQFNGLRGGWICYFASGLLKCCSCADEF